MANISLNSHRFPEQEDFQGTVTAIRRLQETYNIPPSTIASGKLGSTSAIPMSGEINTVPPNLWCVHYMQ